MDTTDTDMFEYEASVRRITEGYVTFVLCSVGFVCNLLAFVTFCTRSVRTSTTSVFLRGLALADMAVLLSAVFRYKTYKLFLDEAGQLRSVFRLDAYVEVYVEPLHWAALGCSSYLTLAVSLERYLAVRRPLTVRQTCSRRPAVLACCAASSLPVLALTAPNLAAYTVREIDFAGTQVAVAVLTAYGQRSLYPCTYHNYLVPLLWYVLPALALTLLNILLSVHVQRSSRIRVGLPHLHNPNRKLTVVIITVVCAYLGCNLPKCAFMFYKLVGQVSARSECVSYSLSAVPRGRTYLLVEVVTELLNVLNSCLNFLLYCLVGTRFRNQLVRLLTCRGRTQHSSVNSNSLRSQRSARYTNERNKQ